MKIDFATAIAVVERHTQYVRTALKYGEPGYDQPEIGIIFADWNRVPRFVGEWLEHHGFSCEWEDEWIEDDECRAWRTSPTSWDWRPSYTSHECTVYGHTVNSIRDCVREYTASRDGDEWGTCTAWWFAVAHEIYARSLDIPDEWQFRPGAACHAPDYGREWERWETEFCATIKDHTLVRFGELLHRHSKALKARGLSY
jgi:hypothetical protein